MTRKTIGYLVPLFALALLLSTAASASTLYSNGPVNGGVDAWTINFGFQVADSFTLGSNSTITGATFGTWTFPGDVPVSVNWEIVTDPITQTIIASGVSPLSTTFLFTNQYGYSINSESFSIPNVNLGSGTYWLLLQNAVVNTGDPLYWDENDGSSAAWESAYGYLTGGNGPCSSPGPTGYCSESFTIEGNSGNNVPEPASLFLLGSGLLGLGGAVRKRMNRA